MNSSLPVDPTQSRRRSDPVASSLLLLLFQTTRDRLGQPLRSVEALGTPAQRVTRFRWHASGQMSHLILENPATGEQVTEWLFGTALERYDDATGTGALNIGPAAAQPRGRANFTAAWHDPIGRSVATAAYGTHSGMAFSRPATPPERSDTVLVSTTDYADTGEANRALDPMGIEIRWHNDAQGRRVRLIENVVASADESDAGANRTTEYRYAPDGGLSELILKNVVTGDQVTRWIYGTSLDDSGVARTDLVRAKLYPESDDDTDPLDDGIDGVFERIEYAYNRQAQVTKLTDPNGTVHQYDLDRLGRLMEDRVTTFAGHIDATVKRISLGYDLRGLTGTVTSFDNATVGSGTVLNQVAFAYDDFGNLVADRQAHSGAVVTGTPTVGYAYADGSANTIRRTAITYPDGRVLDYGYGTAGGVNDRLSRVESLTIQGEAQAAVTYTYGGTARYLKIQYPEPGVQLSYLKTASQPVGDGGDHYTGYDRFGRVVDMRWVTTSGGAERDRFQWGFDRASNRTWRRNVVAATGHDDRYHYDGLYQVTARQQGSLTLDQAAVGGVPAESEAFAYDPTGNWLGYRKDEAGATVLDQERKNNRDNQIVQFDGSSNGVAYDRAGNARLMPPDASGDWDTSYFLTWDAWNRLVRVEERGSDYIDIRGQYAYDGLHRRITKTVGAGGTPLHSYYSDRWKPLEERAGTSTDPARQYVWGARPGHRDELVLRDRDTDGNGSLDERLHALMDYFNGTSIVNTSGVVQERYEYSAFGVRSVMAPDFSPRANSAFAWDFGFQGQFVDAEIGYLNYGYRYYNPMLGRWVNRDPIGEDGGTNLYTQSGNRILNVVDLLGLAWPTSCEEICKSLQKLEDLIRHLDKRIGRFLGSPDLGHWTTISQQCGAARKIPEFIDSCCCNPVENDQRKANIKGMLSGVIARCQRAAARAEAAELAKEMAPVPTSEPIPENLPPITTGGITGGDVLLGLGALALIGAGIAFTVGTAGLGPLLVGGAAAGIAGGAFLNNTSSAASPSA